MPRPIPFSTPGSSIPAHDHGYKAQRAIRGKAISKGLLAAAERREALAGIDDVENEQEDLAEAVVSRKKR